MAISVTCDADSCGNRLDGRTDRRYCSPACRQAAYRSRCIGQPAEVTLRKTASDRTRAIGTHGRRLSTVYDIADNVITNIEYATDGALTFADEYDFAALSEAEALATRFRAAAAHLSRLAAALDPPGSR